MGIAWVTPPQHRGLRSVVWIMELLVEKKKKMLLLLKIVTLICGFSCTCLYGCCGTGLQGSHIVAPGAGEAPCGLLTAQRRRGAVWGPESRSRGGKCYRRSAGGRDRQLAPGAGRWGGVPHRESEAPSLPPTLLPTPARKERSAHSSHGGSLGAVSKDAAWRKQRLLRPWRPSTWWQNPG